jgi:hypothetical protein
MELNAGVAVGAPVGEVVESAEFVAERRRQKGLERGVSAATGQRLISFEPTVRLGL